MTPTKPEARDVEQAKARLIAFATECETEHAPQLEGSVTADASALAATRPESLREVVEFLDGGENA
jgi:hypothetical protein